DGYFVIPYTIGDYLAGTRLDRVDTDHPAFKAVEAEASGRITRLLAVNGSRTVDSFHKELGRIMWDKCGMARTDEGLRQALAEIPKLREAFWRDVRVLGTGEEFNQSLEKAGRVADFLEFAELMCLDALERQESCGGHFREEYQTGEGEALRNDEEYAYVAAWEYAGEGQAPVLHKEPLVFENVHLATRSYK
ncbi:MAG: fumarate reductase/succinate dehydrogenase flavoprotein subunit, partial [Gemmatimonadota bacterium]|nr:fumarate reductase/succinate dehydrogenase flavoprotein subunit [Gemmatimonadota bacterium]